MKLERSNGFQSRTGDVVASREQFGSPTVGSVASGGTDIGQSDVTATPDPEVSAKATRRRFSAEYKLHILKEAEACTPGTGELGALLRR